MQKGRKLRIFKSKRIDKAHDCDYDGDICEKKKKRPAKIAVYPSISYRVVKGRLKCDDFVLFPATEIFTQKSLAKKGKGKGTRCMGKNLGTIKGLGTLRAEAGKLYIVIEP